jgi:hypothetical protein
MFYELVRDFRSSASPFLKKKFWLSEANKISSVHTINVHNFPLFYIIHNILSSKRNLSYYYYYYSVYDFIIAIELSLLLCYDEARRGAKAFYMKLINSFNIHNIKLYIITLMTWRMKMMKTRTRDIKKWNIQGLLKLKRDINSKLIYLLSSRTLLLSLSFYLSQQEIKLLNFWS